MVKTEINIRASEMRDIGKMKWIEWGRPISQERQWPALRDMSLLLGGVEGDKCHMTASDLQTRRTCYCPIIPSHCQYKSYANIHKIHTNPLNTQIRCYRCIPIVQLSTGGSSIIVSEQSEWVMPSVVARFKAHYFDPILRDAALIRFPAKDEFFTTKWDRWLAAEL